MRNRKIMALIIGLIMVMSIIQMVAAEDVQEDVIGAADAAKVGAGKPGPRIQLAKQRIENVKERMQNLKDRYNQAKDNYNDARGKWLEIRNATKPIRGVLNESARVDVSKTFLLASAERIQAHLSRLKEIADDNNRTEVSAELQAKITAIDAIKVDIKAATTMDQVKEQAKKLQDIWKGAQEVVARRHGLIFTEKVKNLINRIENIHNKLDTRLDNIESDGKNATAARAQLNISIDLLAEAKAKVLEAEAEFKLVTGAPGQDEHFKKGQELLKEANELIRESYNALKDFFKDVRQNIKEVRKENREQRKENRGNGLDDDDGDDDDDNLNVSVNASVNGTV